MTVKQTAYGAARAAARTYGRWTAGARLAPSFLIVGAQRCGTTSLYKTLSQHPAVLPAVLHKGVHYFDTGYHRSMAWYLGHFPTRRQAAAVRARHGVAGVTGESSPYYMFHPLAAARIARDLVKRLTERPFAAPVLLNVNVPDLPTEELKGTQITRLGRRHKAEPVVRTINPRNETEYWVGAAGAAQDAGEGTDFNATANGYVSITPLQIDLTHVAQMGQIRDWLGA